MKSTTIDAATTGERPEALRVNTAARNRAERRHPDRSADVPADQLAVGLPPELLTMAEVADRLRSARSTVYELLAAGELSSLTIGRRRYITVAELGRFIASRQEAAR